MPKTSTATSTATSTDTPIGTSLAATASRYPTAPLTITSLAIALWLGSLAHLLLSIATLFSKFPRLLSPVAIEGAPVIFHVTERYHLGLAIVSVVGAIFWAKVAPGTFVKWIVGLLSVAAFLAIMQLGIVTSRMDVARALEDRATFNRLHSVSNVQYLAQTVLVLTAAALVPSAIRRGAK